VRGIKTHWGWLAAKKMPNERVNHPSHYGGDTTYEAIKVIEAWHLGFHLGNTVKYICRANQKEGELEDLKRRGGILIAGFRYCVTKCRK